MEYHTKPVFRRIFVTWFDTQPVRIVLILFMFLILIFGIFGVSAAREEPAYQEYVWVPISLIVLSSIIIITSVYRIFILFPED